MLYFGDYEEPCFFFSDDCEKGPLILYLVLSLALPNSIVRFYALGDKLIVILSLCLQGGMSVHTGQRPC